MMFWNRKKQNQPIQYEKPKPDDVRIAAHFTGIVQGVGFRVEMWRRANEMRLSGWVRNNLDGSVDANLQGNIKKIDTLLEQMQQIPRIQIERIDTQQIPLQDNGPFEMLNY
ncbi:acylphosphatase [Dubosiella newyorkensis]|mgnify:CR=1 FL=1|nr:acylphosphatase [Dubosiella newyorkensis]